MLISLSPISLLVKRGLNYIQIINEYNIMQEYQLKRDQFHKQIRRKQIQQIFHKIRAQNFKKGSPNSKQFSHLLARLPYMYSLCQDYYKLYDNILPIAEYISQIRKFEDDQVLLSENCNPQLMEMVKNRSNNNQKGMFAPPLQFFLYVAQIIYNQIFMDTQESSSVEQDYRSRESGFSEILIPISYLMINLTSNEISIKYINLILKFTKYRLFIDSFHNIFLLQGLTLPIKQQFLDNFLTHLERNPMFCLKNLQAFFKVVYYAIEQNPNLISSIHEGIHTRVINLIQKIYSILPLSQNINIDDKQQFNRYTGLTLEKICERNEKNCWTIVNSNSIMRAIDQIIFDTRKLFNFKGKLDERFSIDHLLQNIKLLYKLTYYSDVTCFVNQCFPTMWIHLQTIFQRISSGEEQRRQKEDKKQQLSIMYLPKFPSLVIQIIGSISNFVCLPQICQSLINGNGKDQSKTKWVQNLTCLYNNYYRINQIRIQCLCMFSNILIIISKQSNMNGESIGQDEFCQQLNQVPLIFHVLNCSSDIISEVLKLTNDKNKIILSVLRTLLIIVENSKSKIYFCNLFKDTHFFNRLNIIAEKKYQKGQKLDCYSEQVRLQAQHLIESVRIINE